uniref:Uncharacterized protein n=1 Tax=Rhipicephalus microplus TaxID=6941 RepID=A0A6M2DBX7_RHIMP
MLVTYKRLLRSGIFLILIFLAQTTVFLWSRLDESLYLGLVKMQGIKRCTSAWFLLGSTLVIVHNMKYTATCNYRDAL